MSDFTRPDPQEPLAVGGILNDTFALVFRNVVPMLTIGAIPAIVSGAVGTLVFGSPVAETPEAVDPEAAVSTVSAGAMAVVALTGVLLWGFATAAVTRAAIAAKAGQEVDLGRAVRTGIQTLAPVITCSLLAGIAAYLGLMVFVLPGLWLMALWSVIVPAVVVEGLGLDAFRRSAELTRGYRWQVVGLVLLFALVALGISLVSGFLQIVAYAAGTLGIIVATLIGVATGALFYALAGTLVALLYARLRAIREGVTPRSLTASP